MQEPYDFEVDLAGAWASLLANHERRSKHLGKVVISRNELRCFMLSAFENGRLNPTPHIPAPAISLPRDLVERAAKAITGAQYTEIDRAREAVRVRDQLRAVLTGAEPPAPSSQVEGSK